MLKLIPKSSIEYQSIGLQLGVGKKVRIFVCLSSCVVAPRVGKNVGEKGKKPKSNVDKGRGSERRRRGKTELISLQVLGFVGISDKVSTQKEGEDGEGRHLRTTTTEVRSQPSD
jgi:hypothetical protein